MSWDGLEVPDNGTVEFTDLERAVFGPHEPGTVDDWLHRHTKNCVGEGVRRTLFRAGRLSPVYGVELRDGRRAVIKVYPDRSVRDRLIETARCQRLLAAGGFPCPEPLAEPTATDGHLAVIEALVEGGDRADAHQDRIRRTMARTLARQVELLSDEPAPALATGVPAWMQHQDGPWPVPHDAIFTWDGPSPGYAWVDELAAVAAERLRDHEAPLVTGHADWVCQNLRFAPTGELVVGYDWDSLVTVSEPVLVGAIAACFTEGSTAGGDASTPAEAARFLTDYADARGQSMALAHRELAAAATLWVMAYNARCDASFVGPGGPADGSALQLLDRHRDAYLAWR